MPVEEEGGYPFGYMKILGALAVIGILIYYKTTNNKPQQPQRQREMPPRSRYNEIEMLKQMKDKKR